MKNSVIIKVISLAVFLFLILLPFSVGVDGGKPTYEELEKRILELE